MPRVWFLSCLLSVATAAPVIPQPGQQYLRVGDEGDYQWRGRDRWGGKGPLYPLLQTHIMTLKKVEPTQAIFAVDGLGEVVRKGSTAAGFPDLAPLVDDSELQQLKKNFLGKTVWPYGGFSTQCWLDRSSNVNVSADVSIPFFVEKVVRLSYQTVLNLNGGYNATTTDFEQTKTDSPVVLIVKNLRGELNFSYIAPDTSYVNDKELTKHSTNRGLRGENCGSVQRTIFPDAASVKRAFGMTPPKKDLAAEASLGLTRLEYAQRFGFPSVTRGTFDEVMRLKEWSYANIPFPITVTFDRAGRVSTVHVPRLP